MLVRPNPKHFVLTHLSSITQQVSPSTHHISVFFDSLFLDSVRCSHDPLLALSRCPSAHWLFVLALSLLSCPFSNLACILPTSFFRLPFCLACTHPYTFCFCPPFYDLLIPRRPRGLFYDYEQYYCYTFRRSTFRDTRFSFATRSRTLFCLPLVALRGNLLYRASHTHSHFCTYYSINHMSFFFRPGRSQRGRVD